LDNADIPFHIESNVILGTSTSSGAGIFLNGSGQFLPSGGLISNLPIKPTIGNADQGGGNVIGGFAFGILVQNSMFPDLRISGNRIGADAEEDPIPNGDGIDITLESAVDRIDGNDIVYNVDDGIEVVFVDGILIEENLIGANGGDGIDLSSSSGAHLIRNNIFDSNSGDGVAIHSVTSGTEARNIEITGNDFLGIEAGDQPIDLGADGVTPNDSGDIDNNGPNQLQNFPVVETITFNNGVWTARVLLDIQSSSTTSAYRLEFYRYDSALKNYEFIRPANISIPANQDFSGSFSFIDGTELSEGDQLAMIAIADSGTQDGNTSEMSGLSAPLNAPPKVIDVRLTGGLWTGGQPYSYAPVVQSGRQLRPFYGEGVNRIQVQFSEPVTVPPTALTLYANSGTTIPLNFDGYDPVARVATWSTASELQGKYRIRLASTVEDVAGSDLDGEWLNLAAPLNQTATYDNFADDPSRSFATHMGDGLAGGMFEFFFSVLPGDYNQDGIVNAADAASGTVQDGDGDGMIESGPTADDTAIATGNAGQVLARISPPVDYHDNDLVNIDDYYRWKETYGSTTVLDADGNGDGVVGPDDYVLWRHYYDIGTYFSAWYSVTVPGGGSGGGGPYVQVGVAPTVTNVIISGLQSNQDFHPPFLVRRK
jgi:hypothetical protein